MKVAVVGVGVMGSAIAGRLLDCDVEVHLYDRNGNAGSDLVARGAHRSQSAAAAAAAADVVITSLNSAEIVETAVFGAGGVAEAADRAKLLIDMSSIDPGATARFARR